MGRSTYQYASKGVGARLAGVGARGGCVGRVGAPGRVGGTSRRAGMHQNVSGRMSGVLGVWLGHRARQEEAGGAVGASWCIRVVLGVVGKWWASRDASGSVGLAWGYVRRQGGVDGLCGGHVVHPGGVAARQGHVQHGTGVVRHVRALGGASAQLGIENAEPGGHASAHDSQGPRGVCGRRGWAIRVRCMGSRRSARWNVWGRIRGCRNFGWHVGVPWGW